MEKGRLDLIYSFCCHDCQCSIEDKLGGDYDRIYPCDDSDRLEMYEHLIEKARVEFFGRGVRHRQSKLTCQVKHKA